MEYQELIKACKKNSYKAQMEVYHLCKDMLYGTSLRIVKNTHDAQDIVHDAFIKGFQGIQKLEEDANLKAWLKRITINCSLDFLRSKKKVSWLEDNGALYQDEIHTEDEELLETQQLSVALVKKAIDGLKDKYRVIVVLYLIENYSHKEIAEILHLNESTVRNQYKRGKDQLKKQLQNKIVL